MVNKYRKREITLVKDLEKNTHYVEFIDTITQKTTGGNLVVLPIRSKVQDEMFARRIFEREISALSELYDLHSKYLYTIIYYILRDKAEAEDLLQEVFLKIWDKIGSYDESLGNLLTWITKITRNKSIDRLRSKSFKNRSSETDIERIFDLTSDSESSDPEKILSLNQEETLISDALKSLNLNQRNLIEFAFFRGYSQSELAGHFDIPLGTVKTRMRTAMSLLREKLKNLV
jgi:RNA polymerase sigma-70 factor (ECF subfamily)